MMKQLTVHEVTYIITLNAYTDDSNARLYIVCVHCTICNSQSVIALHQVHVITLNQNVLIGSCACQFRC